MNFEEALKLLKAGKKVRKCSWTNSQKLYLYLENNEFWLATGEIAGTIGIHYDDMLADDWEEYKSPLSDEEKEYLKMIIKFYPEKIEKISIYRSPHYTLIYLEYGDKASYKESYLTGSNHFENMEVGKHYTLKELGLDE